MTDIERRYGQRKPIAQRTPLQVPASRLKANSSSGADSPQYITDISSTPTATDGETATDSDALDTETETESDSRTSSVEMITPKTGSFTPPKRTLSGADREGKRSKVRAVSQHDLLNKYFRRDTLLLHNIDLFR